MTIRSYQYQVQVLVTASGGIEIVRSVSESLGITDEAYRGTQRTVEDDLDLQQFATFTVLPFDGIAVVQDWGITDEAVSTLHPTVEHDLDLLDAATYELLLLSPEVSHNLGLSDTVEFGWKVRNITVEQDLGITDAAGQAFNGSIIQSLGLTDEARFTDIFQDLGLTDLAEWGYGFDVEQDLNLTQAVDLDKILTQTVAQAWGITHACTYFIESRCNRFSFNSFHGEGGVAPAARKLEYTNTFLIQSLDTGTILSLRNPETDNRRRYAFNRVNREFFDGTPDIYADANWVTEETQIYTLTAIKRADVETLWTFLLDNLGREVLIKDWKGVTWIVIITNPGEVYTEDSEGRWTIDFEVTGEAVDGEYVVEPLGVSDDLSRAGSIWTRSVANSDVVTDRVLRQPTVDQDLGLSDTASFAIVVP